MTVVIRWASFVFDLLFISQCTTKSLLNIYRIKTSAFIVSKYENQFCKYSALLSIVPHCCNKVSTWVQLIYTYCKCTLDLTINYVAVICYSFVPCYKTTTELIIMIRKNKQRTKQKAPLEKNANRKPEKQTKGKEFSERLQKKKKIFA